MKKAGFIIAILLFSLTLLAGRSKVKKVEGGKIPVTATYHADPQDIAFLHPYQETLSNKMKEEVGFSDQKMSVLNGEAESLLGNFTADLILSQTAAATGIRPDIALMNAGGIRTSLPQGVINLGHIFSVFPFDNKLVLLTVKGSDLFEALEAFEKNIQCIAGARLTLKKGEPYQLEIGGEPIRKDRYYKVATIDFLAEGNDGFDGLKEAVERVDPDYLLRDAVIDYVRQQTAQNKHLRSVLDQRVVILK